MTATYEVQRALVVPGKKLEWTVDTWACKTLGAARAWVKMRREAAPVLEERECQFRIVRIEVVK